MKRRRGSEPRMTGGPESVNLVQQVTEVLGGDREKAESVLGTIFTCIRMSVDAGSFGEVSDAWPDADTWMRGIKLADGKTGEIVVLTGEAALRHQLRKEGLTEVQIQLVTKAVGSAVQATVSKDVVKKIAKRVPLIAS